MNLTASMRRFLKDGVLPHYMLYSKADNYAFCTSCQHEVTIDMKGTKPRKEIKCPSCKRTVILKAKGQTKNTFWDWGVGIICERVDRETIMVHYFDVEKVYTKDGTLADFTIKECLRETFGPTGFREAWDNSFAFGWKHCNLRRYGNWKGAEGEPCYHINTNWHFANAYTGNLKEVIKDTIWEHSCMDGIFKLKPESKAWFSVRGFLQGYILSPIDEYLYKVGFKNLVICSVFGSLPTKDSEQTLPDMLGVNRENYKKLLTLKNPTYEDLRKYQRISQYGFSESDYEVFKKYLESKFYYSYFGKTDYEEYSQLFPKTLYQFGKYADTIPDFKWSYYRDYLTMCKELKYDLNNTFVLFPKDLKLAHDLAVAHLERKREQKKKRKYKKDNKTYIGMADKHVTEFSFEKDNLAIVVPKDCDEICKEGQDLHHCVGSYVDRIAKGKSIILFVRKKNNISKSFYTMEIVGDTITQCRGYSNVGKTKEVERFVKSFAKSKHLLVA